MTQSSDLGAISNISRSLFRDHVNTGFKALANYSFGTSAPSVPYPYMEWYDTASGKIKKRDSSNSIWVVVGNIGSDSGSTPRFGLYTAADIINVKAYGAIGDGSTDDTTNIQTALTAAANKTLYFPPGRYILSSQLAFSNASIDITGSGRINSELRWTSGASSRGIYISSNDVKYHHHIHNLTFSSAGTAGTAITLDYSPAVSGGIGGRILPQFTVEDCIITGSAEIDSRDTGSTGWDNGVVSSSAIGGTVRNVHVMNRSISAFRGVSTSVGIQFVGNPVLGNYENGHPVEFYVDGCRVYFCGIGVDFVNCEGAFVGFCNTVACDYGIRAKSEYNHPQLNVHDCHSNNWIAGVWVDGQNQFNIHNNLLYGINTNSGWSGILVEAASNIGVISGNILTNIGTNGTGIVVMSGWVTMDGNVFIKNGTNLVTGHWLKSTSGLCKVIGPIYGGSGSITTVLDQGNSNSVTGTVSYG